ncbi:hypothetical protein SK128_028291 [Halocaridina rubra]|uniref:Amino acid transporter transmembrane domain-containing protein n=1 Tax=Halocaridina rubra TaxID=373956 RepID=A0AAN8WS87_HALRR
MAGNTRQVVNMANSIVGVSILSMPFCFKETGLLLGIVLVLVSGFITKRTCMFLIRSAIMARRRSYEFLAFHVFGVSGKLFVELCMIFFLIGICVSFHVVMGDLAPAIVARLLNVENSPSLRCTLLIGIALLVILPLCLLRNLDNLASMSACSIMFYIFLITVILWHAFPKLWDGTWVHIVELWRLSGALQVLPICCLGLACQSNIFEIYDSVPDPDVPKMRFVVNHAVNLCSALYISVGFLGYVAFVDKDFGGNIIMSFPSSELTEGIKLFFIISLAISFPLMIFPCRTSIHSLLYRRSNPTSFDLVGNYMPESRFKGITLGILVFSLIIGILIPNIEFVLGLLGSTMGMLIALILPSLLFIKVNTKASAERLFAQAIMLMGILLVVTGTYLNLAHIYEVQSSPQVAPTPETIRANIEPQLPKVEEKMVEVAEKSGEALPVGIDTATRKEPVAPEPPPEEDKKIEEKKDGDNENDKDKLIKNEKVPKNDLKEDQGEEAQKQDLIKIKEESGNVEKSEKEKENKGGDTLHPDAIQKEEKENEEEKDKEQGKMDIEKKQAEILEKIEEQHQEQQQILEVQKKILKELEEAKIKTQEEAKKQEESKINAAVVGNAAVDAAADGNLPAFAAGNVQVPVNQVDNAPAAADGALNAPVPVVGNAPVAIDEILNAPVSGVGSEDKLAPYPGQNAAEPVAIMAADIPQNKLIAGSQINLNSAKDVPVNPVRVDSGFGNDNNNLASELKPQPVPNDPSVSNDLKIHNLARDSGIISQNNQGIPVGYQGNLPGAHFLNQQGAYGGLNAQAPVGYRENLPDTPVLNQQGAVENINGQAPIMYYSLNQGGNPYAQKQDQVVVIPLENQPGFAARADIQSNIRGNNAAVESINQIPAVDANSPSKPIIQNQLPVAVGQKSLPNPAAQPIAPSAAPSKIFVKDINQYVTGQRNYAPYPQKPEFALPKPLDRDLDPDKYLIGSQTGNRLNPELEKSRGNKRINTSVRSDINPPLKAKHSSLTYDKEARREKLQKAVKKELYIKSDREKTGRKLPELSKSNLDERSVRKELDDKKVVENVLDRKLDAGDAKQQQEKAQHDEERRKREAVLYTDELPKIDLMRDLKWKDVGDFSYDTRHLLWTGRSRRRRRNKGRDEDYYWDET